MPLTVQWAILRGDSMTSKKIYTIPNGNIIFAVTIVPILLAVVLGLFMLPDPVSFALLSLSVVFALFSFECVRLKHINYINITDQAVKHGNICYTWDNVCLTVQLGHPNFFRKSYDYYVYFSDHYMTEKEIKSKETKKQGFYIVLNEKRVEMLLSLYKKRIAICDQGFLKGHQKINEIIKHHNIDIES